MLCDEEVRDGRFRTVSSSVFCVEPSGSADRRLVIWLFWLSATLYPTYLQVPPCPKTIPFQLLCVNSLWFLMNLKFRNLFLLRHRWQSLSDNRHTSPEGKGKAAGVEV
jgi:hypothetical protein